MIAAYGDERKEMFLAFSMMLGGKPKTEGIKPGKRNGKLSDYDTSKVDNLSKKHMDKLKRKAK